MKKLILASILWTMPLIAQAPPTVSTLQTEQDKLSAQLQLLYEDLHAITQFQQYLQVRAQYDQNQAQLKAAQSAPVKPKTVTEIPVPTPSPARPGTQHNPPPGQAK